ncbi:YgfZ/GcvT domain-containing protein [Rubrobacter indicoceani]|uniref:CAF17-like 4Fe-4S cluster assembly/insertion protein YgfZ n=1 Tax=Rubrobacter indicoceani TaxID=2051957 RepID=UPI0013C428D8|nr:folate-binding protein YgfZ [Rubrobacter indicoceani]
MRKDEIQNPRYEKVSIGLPFEEGVFTVEFPERRVLRLSRKSRAGDPTGMLDAILTNDAPKEEAGAVYSLLLNAKGRVLTDVTVVKDGEDLLVVVEGEGVEAARETLGRYAPFSRVEVQETELVVLGLFGPGASDIVPDGEETVYASPLFEPSFLLLTAGDELPRTLTRLKEAGAVAAEEKAYETERVYRAIPRFGRDVTPENFPAEAHLERRAIDFKKGCYPGQETVARMHYRGQPNKLLYRFMAEGNVEPGSAIFQNEKEVGYVTSVAPLEVDGETYALGYLKRRADATGELVSGNAALKASAPVDS